MARRSGLLHAIAQAQREAERNRKAQLHEMERAQNEAARAAEKARKDYERAVTADQKERPDYIPNQGQRRSTIRMNN